MLMSVDGHDVLPEVARACGAAALLRKQDLRPRKLRAMWEELRPDAPS
jgi:hypothetical protein